MYLIELLLPLYDNSNHRLAQSLFEAVRGEMTERFGGVTTFSRAPAEGFWKESEHHVRRDDVVIVEVMANQLDESWWAQYRQELERRFQQEEIVIRATQIKRL